VAEADPTERLRRTVRGAERALEQQTIPLRHRDLVQRVFQRIKDRTAAPGPAPTDTADAPDVVPEGG